jgi:hypothetical protein
MTPSNTSADGISRTLCRELVRRACRTELNRRPRFSNFLIRLAAARRAGRLLSILKNHAPPFSPRRDDIDAVILLPVNFAAQVEQGNESAIELEQMLLTRRPEELFAAEDESDWNEWFEFFSRTRETDGRRKGLVEIQL